MGGTAILDEFEDIIYVADLETYELLFLNKAAQKVFASGLSAGGKCYEILQDKDTPCEFCTNHLLTRDAFYCWEYTNLKFGRHFLVKDKMILWEGRKARLQVAIDITTKEKEKDKIQRELNVESTIVDCIRILDRAETQQEAIDRILEVVGRFYMADRCYLLPLGGSDARQAHEWCARGVKRTGGFRTSFLAGAEPWKSLFLEKGELVVESLAKILAENALPIPPVPGLEAFMVVPVANGGQISDGLGVDNPRAFLGETSLLRSMAYFIETYVEKQHIRNYLEELSYTDTLTRLGNRNKYITALQRMKDDPPGDFGVIFIDVNGLKAANDAYGHDYGDRIIVRVADVLRDIFTDMIFRTGGDEYVVICNGMGRQAFSARVEDMRAAFSKEPDCDVSCGVVWKSGVEDIDALIRYADELMYVEKQSYYKSNLGKRSLHHSSLLEETLQSLEHGEFIMYLQPKVSLGSGSLCGAEALIRKKGKNHELVQPDSFVPLLESELLIRHVDFFVLHEACKLLKAWSRQGIPLLPLSVNLSRVTLMEHNIVESIAAVCDMYGVPHELIDIEITESVGKLSIESLVEVTNNLSGSNFTISLDDFGSQYCNMDVLTNIKFNYLKLDRSIISILDRNLRSSIITKYFIEMCMEMDNVHSVAEGIETRRQLDILRMYHCDYGQGYFFSRPLDVTSFERLYAGSPHSMERPEA